MNVKQFSSDKILAHIDRINEWIETGFSHPITYEFDMTNVCNMRCPFCFGWLGKKGKERLSLKEAKDIIRQIKIFGGRGIIFTGGGEPLCNSATPEAVRYARGIELDVGFITNGLSLNEKIARILVKNCVWVRISLDAASPKVYKLTHGMEEKIYWRVLENIKLLVRSKKENRTNCSIGIGYLTPPLHKGEIYSFAMLGRKLGIDYAQFRPLLRRHGEKEIKYDNLETISMIEKCAKELSDENYSVLYSKHKYDDIKSGTLKRSYKKCYGHHFATVIAADKKMYLCCHTRGIKKYCLGDLEKNRLEEIWYSKKRKEIYENIDFKDCPPLCRCNTFNTVLWNIKQPKVHRNFL